MKPYHRALLSLLSDAAAEPIGLLLVTEDPEALRDALYRVRAKEPAFSHLQFRMSPFPEGDLAITKGTKEPSNE